MKVGGKNNALYMVLVSKVGKKGARYIVAGRGSTFITRMEI